MIILVTVVKYIIYNKDAINHSLDAAHSLNSLSGKWAWPIPSTVCRLNGIVAHPLDRLPIAWAQAHSLNRLSSEWDRGPSAPQVIE